MPEYGHMTQQKTDSRLNQNTRPAPGGKEAQPEHERAGGQHYQSLYRTVADPFSSSANDILALHRIAGNRMVGQVIQAKLSVGPAGDRYEQEAERVAEQVTNRHAADDLNTRSLIAPARPMPARTTASSDERDQELQAGPQIENMVKSPQSGGKPLPDKTRQAMESEMGADFSRVRIHTGPEAGQANRDLQAEAFTYGHDIYMAEGRYQPESNAGQRLLAHELTHVVQQGGPTRPQTIQRNGSWLSRLFGRKKKEERLQTPASAASPAQWVAAHPHTPPATQPSPAQWLEAHPQHASGPSGPAIGTRPAPSAPGEQEDSGTYTTPVSSPSQAPASAYSSFPATEPEQEDSGTYTTPVSSPSQAPASTYSSFPATEPAQDGGTYTTPATEPAQDSGTYTTQATEPVQDGGTYTTQASEPAQDSGAYTTPDQAHEETSGPTQPAARRRATGGTGTGSSADSIPLTLPKMVEFEGETERSGIWGRQGLEPTYYQPQDQPNPYKLDVQNGRLRQAGADLSTRGILPQFNKDKSHRHMFTMDEGGQFYSAGVRQGFAEHGRVHHTTMGGGREAAAAGELQVNQGRLEAISDASGHYRPGAAMTYQALRHLGGQGVDLSAANVELSGKQRGQKALSLSATEMMAYQPEMEESLAEAREYRSTHPLEGDSRGKREDRIRDILNRPEEKIRAAHAKKDSVLQELMQKTASRRERLDQAGPAPEQGRRDLTQFEYEEALKGTHQASHPMSGRITPAQAEAERKELKAHWEAQQQRHAPAPVEPELQLPEPAGVEISSTYQTPEAQKPEEQLPPASSPGQTADPIQPEEEVTERYV